jgi:hypothetical protein
MTRVLIEPEAEEELDETVHGRNVIHQKRLERAGLLLRRASDSRAINDSGSPPSALDRRTEQIFVTGRSIKFEVLKPQRVACGCPR